MPDCQYKNFKESGSPLSFENHYSVLFYERQYIFFRSVTDQLIDCFAVFEINQRGYALDSEAVCERGLIVNIDFADFDIASLFRYLSDDGAEHHTRAAPGCPEIKQYGFI
jgi:hypothetical protein